MITTLQDLYVKQLKRQFPALDFFAYNETLFEDTDQFASYNSPAGLLVILPTTAIPGEEDQPWDCVLNWGLIIISERGGMSENVKSGWDYSEKIAAFIHRTCIFPTGATTPCLVTGISRHERKDLEGLPTGAYYWTITFSQKYRYDNSL